MENRIYSGDQKEPVSQSLTVFQQGVVYDFLQEPAETIIFDKAAARFAILDNLRQIRTEMTTAAIDSFTQKLKDRAAKHQDPLTRFLADPVFEEHFDPTRSELLLKSPLVNYRVIVTAADNVALAAQYREFSDWNARLSAILNPGSRPPFARLKLNEALANRESVPRQVTLTIASPGDQNHAPATMRSEHQLSSSLTPADLERIQRAQQAAVKYKPVAFDKYYQAKK